MGYNPYYDQVDFQAHKYEDQPALGLLDWGLRRLVQRRASEPPDDLRAALRQSLLGVVESDLAELPIEFRVGASSRQAECDCWELSLDLGGLVEARATFILPRRRLPRSPLYLCLHGHQHEGRQWTIRAGPAAALTRAGYACLCPDLLGLGETRGDTDNLVRGNITYDLVVHDALMLGWSLNGLRLWTLERWLELVESHAFFGPWTGGIASAGFSLGGELALLLSALDQRIAPLYISDYACSWQASYWSKLHCRCAYMPGLMRLADLVDLYRLVAPRPLALEVSRFDASFPWPDTEQLLEQIGAHYYRLGARPRMHWVVKDSEHSFHCAPETLSFLESTIDAHE